MIPEQVNEMYKKEAMSSMALARNVGTKLNELIDAVNEFQSARDNKYLEQDGKIQKAIIYMKNNLKNTINDLLQIMRQNGELGEVVADSIFGEFNNIKNATDDLIHPENFGAIGNRNF